MYEIMDPANNGNPLYCLLFLIVIVIGLWVEMNLFILILLNAFEKNFLQKDNPMKDYKEQISHFKEIWANFTREEKGKKIK